MKCEGMPTQRLEEKRVEEHVGEGERERGRERERAHACRRGRERERAHARGRERASTLAPPFTCVFLHLGLPYANWT